MRIAFVIPSLSVGGAERVSISLANMLCDRGHDVSMITFWSSGTLHGILRPTISVISLGITRSHTAADAVAEAWLRIDPQVVLSALNTTNAVCCKAKMMHHLTAPLICAIHARLYGKIDNLGILRQRIWALLTRLYAKSADVITTPSDGVSCEARKLFKNSDVRTMPNAVIQKACVEIDLERDHKQLLWLGRLTPPKNPQLVIRAFAKYARECDWRLLVAGDGPLRGSLLNLAAKMGISDRVVMMGEVADPSELLRTSGCLMFASHSEALPTVLIEAMQCGMPIVATDTPGGLRSLLSGADYGHIVPLTDAAAMAEATKVALGSHPIVPVEFLKQFEPSHVCQRYEELFQEVINKKKSS